MVKNQNIQSTRFSSFSKSLLTVTFFLSIIGSLFSQDQRLADSLETVYVNGDYEEEKKLELLRQLAINHPVSEAKIKYSNELLALLKEMDSSKHFYTAYLEKGNAYHTQGELPLAIENFLNAGDIALQNGDSVQLAMMYGSVANIYYEMGNVKTGISFYKKSIDIIKNNLKKKRDTIQLAYSIENLGYNYSILQKPDSALIYLNESSVLLRQINDTIGLAYKKIKCVTVFAHQNNYNNTEKSKH